MLMLRETSNHKYQKVFLWRIGEIMQMHTIHESNYTVIKLPRNGWSNAKQKQQNTIQFVEVIKQN